MKIWTALRMFVWMTFLTGIIYPLFITIMAQLSMKQKADGNIIISSERPIGALLIGQKFESDKYFWGRPSATDYSTLPSGGSNLGPISAQLKSEVEKRKEKNAKTFSTEQTKIPSELLFASGSGVDPHISIQTAKFQIDRIIKTRGLDENAKQQLAKLIDQIAEQTSFRFFEPTIVNVLMLNIALDEQFKMNH